MYFRIVAVFLSACLTVVVATGAKSEARKGETVPMGHLQKLGSHRPMEDHVKVLMEIPHPIDFFNEYAKPDIPVVLKGAAKTMPAFKLWTDAYMKQKSGDQEVQIEPGKKENRTRVAIEGTAAPFSEFLDIYNTSDIYMVDSIPTGIAADFYLLRCLLCGGYTDYLQMSVMWFSSGGTKSVLHNDPQDNINCVLSGRKEFFLADKKFLDDLVFSSTGNIDIDVDAVDLLKMPQMKNVEWWHADVEEGDCLFIPQEWLHQVRSYGRNLAVNIWWSRLYRFNHSDCYVDSEMKERKSLPDGASYSEFEIKNGSGHKGSLLEQLHQSKKKQLTLQQMIDYGSDLLSADEDFDEREFLRMGKKLFKKLDTNKDKVIDEDELYSSNVQDLYNVFGELPTGYSAEAVDGPDEDGSTDGGEEDAEENSLQFDEDDTPGADHATMQASSHTEL